MIYWMDKRYSDALNLLLDDPVKRACESLWIYHNLVGMSARQIDGELEERLLLLKDQLLDPDRPDTLYNFANLLKDDNLVRFLCTVVLLEPTAAAAWHNYGSTLSNLTARRSFVLSRVKSRSLIADVWCNLGLAYFGLEDFARAERSFRYAISLDESHAQSYTNLGNALISTLQPEEALTHLEKGVELDQSSTHSLWNLALAYLLLGDYLKGWEY